MDSAGHGRHAFEEAFDEVVGGDPEWVEYAGRTDHQIALSMLNGSADHLPALLEQLADRLAARKHLIASEGHVYPGVPETLAALHEADGVINSLLTGNLEGERRGEGRRVRARSLARLRGRAPTARIRTSGAPTSSRSRASEPRRATASRPVPC